MYVSIRLIFLDRRMPKTYTDIGTQTHRHTHTYRYTDTHTDSPHKLGT